MSNFSLAEYHRHPAWSPTALKAAVTGTMRTWNHRFGPGAARFIPSADMVKGDLVDALLTPPFGLMTDSPRIDQSPATPRSAPPTAQKRKPPD